MGRPDRPRQRAAPREGRGFLGTRQQRHLRPRCQLPDQYFNDITTGNSGANTRPPATTRPPAGARRRPDTLIPSLVRAERNPFDFRGLEWDGQFILPITEVGPLAGPVAGFFTGRGTITGNSVVDNVLTPEQQYNGVLTSFVLNPATKNPRNGKFSGFGTATIFTNVAVPTLPPGGPGANPNADAHPDADAPAPSDAYTHPGADSDGPTQQIINLNISFVGKVYRSESGRQHVIGTFINIIPNQTGTGFHEPDEGREVIFRGEFNT